MSDQTPRRRFSPAGSALAVLLLVALVIFMHSAAYHPDATSTPAPAGSGNAPAAAAPAWVMSSEKDPLTDKTQVSSCLTSVNTIDFAFPYGTVHGSLCFRKTGSALNGYFRVDKGQFTCGIEGCPVKLRCDDSAIENFAVGRSRTGESDIVFFQNPAKALARAKSCKRIRLASGFYEEGERTFDFSLTQTDPFAKQ